MLGFLHQVWSLKRHGALVTTQRLSEIPAMSTGRSCLSSECVNAESWLRKRRCRCCIRCVPLDQLLSAPIRFSVNDFIFKCKEAHRNSNPASRHSYDPSLKKLLKCNRRSQSCDFPFNSSSTFASRLSKVRRVGDNLDLIEIIMVYGCLFYNWGMGCMTSM